MRNGNILSGCSIALPGCHIAICTYLNAYTNVKIAIYRDVFL